MPDLRSTPLSNNGQSAGPAVPATLAHPILQECAEIAAVRLADALARSLDLAASDLAYLANQPHMVGESRAFLDAVELARKRGRGLCDSFRMHYLRHFSAHQQWGSGEVSDGSLDLVGQDDLQQSLATHGAITQLREACGSELYSLELNLGSLLGRGSVRQSENPLGPHIIGLSLMDALSEQYYGLQSKLTLLSAVCRYLPAEARQFYRDLNQHLVSRGVCSPALLPVYGHAEGGTDSAHCYGGAPVVELALPEAPDLPLLDPGPSGEGAEEIVAAEQRQGDAPPPVQEPFLPVADAMPGGVQAVLRECLDEVEWPAAMRASLAGLRLCLLGMATREPARFARPEHPARRFMQRLREAVQTGHNGDYPSASFCAILSSMVERLADQDEGNEALFADALVDLDTFLAGRGGMGSGPDDADSPFALLDRGQIEAARLHGHQAIQTRLRTYALPDAIRSFLIAHWEPLLVRLYIKSGADSDAWRQAVGTMDDLIWSVLPKVSGRDQKRMVELIPGLLKRLEAGLLSTATSSPVRDHFFATLVRCHAEAIRAGQAAGQATPGIAHAGTPERGQSAATVTIEDLMDEPAPEATQPEDAYTAQVSLLRKGAMVEFLQDDGSRLQAKLAWVSPMRGMYLFTNQLGQRALSIRAAGLADKLRQGQAKVLSAVTPIQKESETPLETARRNAA